MLQKAQDAEHSVKNYTVRYASSMHYIFFMHFDSMLNHFDNE
jgi:hypothetical protein